MGDVQTRLWRISNWVRGALDLAGARKEAVRAFDGIHKTRRERLLLVASFDPRGLKNIRENIEEWCEQSRYPFDLLNLFHFPGRGGLAIPAWVDLNDYAGVVLHCTVSYSPHNLNSLDRKLKTGVSAYQGIKVLMKQDEHYRTRQIAAFVKSRALDLLITLVEPDRVHEIYPRESIGDVEFLFAITGYVSRGLRQLNAPPLAGRPIDVGYRGSIQPLSFGTLAFEKREIGERFETICAEHRLACDISSRAEDLFLGDEWPRFLCRIKATLGAESGASIVDFDGTVEHKCNDYLRQQPAAKFSDIFENVLRPYEENAYYKAISPRHLEAAACRTTQVMYEGRYNGIFAAGRHYIPLRRDFANAAEVVGKLRDLPYCQDMVDRTYEEVILDPEHSYETYVTEFDDCVGRLLAVKGGGR